MACSLESSLCSGMLMGLGQACNGGCCRYRVSEDKPLSPPYCDCRPSTDYRPRPYCPQNCDTPPSCWCHPCVAPTPCCRSGACNPRKPPPGACPPPFCCQPCKIPKKCMPPPCRRCNRPCCSRPPLLPVPAYHTSFLCGGGCPQSY